MRKGDLSINIIIVAAIALLILVILAVLLFRTGGDLNQGTSCSGVGGQCVDACSDIQEEGNWVPHATAKCTSAGQICCIKL